MQVLCEAVEESTRVIHEGQAAAEATNGGKNKQEQEWASLDLRCALTFEPLNDPAKGDLCKHRACCNYSALRNFALASRRCPLENCAAGISRVSNVQRDVKLRALLQHAPPDATTLWFKQEQLRAWEQDPASELEQTASETLVTLAAGGDAAACAKRGGAAAIATETAQLPGNTSQRRTGDNLRNQGKRNGGKAGQEGGVLWGQGQRVGMTSCTCTVQDPLLALLELEGARQTDRIDAAAVAAAAAAAGEQAAARKAIVSKSPGKRKRPDGSAFKWHNVIVLGGGAGAAAPAATQSAVSGVPAPQQGTGSQSQSA